MLKRAFSIYITFFRLYLANSTIANDILTRNSFRFSKKSGSKKLRFFVSVLKQVLYEKKLPIVTSSGVTALIFDGKDSSRQLRLKYVETFFDKTNPVFLARESLIQNLGKLERVLCILNVLSLIPMLVLLKHKRQNFFYENLVYLFKEYTEWYSLNKTLDLNNFGEVYFYSPFEIDANFITKLMLKKNIEVLKFPSPGPLFGHNKNTLCSTLVISNAYHQEEIELNKVVVEAKNIIARPPEYWGNYKQQRDQEMPQKYQLAYYSTATAVRKKKFSTDSYVGNEKTEKELLIQLAKLCSQKSIPLVVFLHPKEKSEPIDQIEFYYKSIVGNQVELILETSNTIENFKAVNVAVGTYSTVLFDRLYCGYKTLFYTKGIDDFPTTDSRLSAICSDQPDELIRSVKSALTHTDFNFFENNAIEDYPWFGFPIS